MFPLFYQVSGKSNVGFLKPKNGVHFSHTS